MVADTASIRAELEELHDLPTPVREWRVEEGLDATDDPAVWVWAMIEDDGVDVDALRRLKSDGSERGPRRGRPLGLHPHTRRRRDRSYGVSLPRDLLAQATLLATKERSRPRQANLRRSLSASY